MPVVGMSDARSSRPGGTLVLTGALLGLSGMACDAGQPLVVSSAVACEAEVDSLYQRRIAPLFADDRPGSCNQCHLSGVDLGLFARETPCETMACLVGLELVDLQEPEESLVLSWIQRAVPEGLITQATIDEEYAGFREWIELHAACGSELCGDIACKAPVADSCAAAQKEPGADALEEVEDTGACDDRSLENLFQQTVYAWRGRCFPCHYDNQPFAPDEAPRWISTAGNCDAASLSTMRRIVAEGYVDLEDPERSLLLLKPLAESAGGVEHGGHDKMAGSEDVAYRAFLRWLERYSACVR